MNTISYFYLSRFKAWTAGRLPYHHQEYTFLGQCLIDQCIDQWIHQCIDQWIHQCIDQSIHQCIDQCMTLTDYGLQLTDAGLKTLLAKYGNVINIAIPTNSGTIRNLCASHRPAGYELQSPICGME